MQPDAEARLADVAAICAASVGLIRPGRNATRNASRPDSRASIAVVSQASSHHAPVGVSAPVKPSSSAARTIDDRYPIEARRSPAAAPAGWPCPPPTTERESS